MRTIALTRGYVTVVDDTDYAFLSQWRWRALVQGQAPNLRVYAVSAVVRDDGTRNEIRLHRVLWQHANGAIPRGAEIDHREPGQFGGLDNRRSNLRLTTKALNQANSRKGRNNTSGFKGVWWQKQARLWRADLIVNGRKRHLGYFQNKEDAARAYDRAAVEAFGEHARVNFPNGRAA